MVARQTLMQIRAADAANVFSDSATPVSEVVLKSSNTQGDKWRHLEKQMGKELAKWSEATALEKDIEAKRVPRGHRIYTVPTYDTLNPVY